MGDPVIETQCLSVMAGERPLLRDVSLTIRQNEVAGIIGPSGAGKSTLLKCLNRLVELGTALRVQGRVLFHGRDIYAKGADADALRAKIGILFQQPVVFPANVYENVIFGLRHLGRVPRAELPAAAERALREVALWDEVKDRLSSPAMKLSVGQQQRLCLARTLATQPEVILMDEPTSALDPRNTEAIEQLVLELKRAHTLVLVTHNLRQARKLSDTLTFIGIRDGAGQLLCHGTTAEVLEHTRQPELDSFLCCQ